MSQTLKNIYPSLNFESFFIILAPIHSCLQLIGILPLYFHSSGIIVGNFKIRSIVKNMDHVRFIFVSLTLLMLIYMTLTFRYQEKSTIAVMLMFVRILLSTILFTALISNKFKFQNYQQIFQQVNKIRSIFKLLTKSEFQLSEFKRDLWIMAGSMLIKTLSTLYGVMAQYHLNAIAGSKPMLKPYQFLLITFTLNLIHLHILAHYWMVVKIFTESNRKLASMKPRLGFLLMKNIYHRILDVLENMHEIFTVTVAFELFLESFSATEAIFSHVMLVTRSNLGNTHYLKTMQNIFNTFMALIMIIFRYEKLNREVSFVLPFAHNATKTKY